MKNIEYILFDAANTLIHKPQLWDKISEVLYNNGFQIPLTELKQKHKLVSELIKFPDVTSEEFYKTFNTEFLNSLGIVATPKLLDEIFYSCKNLPWKAFEDASILKDLPQKIGVLSNFNRNLSKILSEKFPDISFEHIFISEEVNLSKPNTSFFKYALEQISINPNKILYIGDSMKLDVLPALSVGIQVKLIDRDSVFPYSKHQINSLRNLF